MKVRGLANVDVDLRSSRPGSRHGRVAIEMVGAEIPGIPGISGLASATFTGDRVRVDGGHGVVEKL